ncbi:MAG: YebC/PmpR family DNA-binding transcriptional regulator [Bacteroidales bacterium]|nr:YebC/PmpR family DNA-binding transcriptional regulator [Bacteroidales bacterium]
MGRAFEYRKARIMARNSKNSKAFSKFSKEITMCVKAGGPDPDLNSRLRTIIASAKSAGMPKDTIDRAIKKATEKDTSDYKEVVFEGYGPFGIAIYVECATDNNTRTVANVRSYFTKFGGSLGTSGCLSFLFTRKTVFTVKAKEGVDMEELELELIDFGVDELYKDEEENTITVYGEPEHYASLQKYFEENGYELVSAEFERIPNETKEVTDEQKVTLEKLLDKFDEDEDVTNVYHTVANL